MTTFDTSHGQIGGLPAAEVAAGGVQVGRPARSSWIVGFVVAFCTVAAGVPLPMSWYITVLLAPTVVALVWLFSRTTTPIERTRLDPIVIVLCTWVGLSISWGQGVSTLETVTAAAALIMSLSVAHVAGAAFPTEGLYRRIGQLLGILMVLVVVYSVVKPGIAFSPGVGEDEGTRLRGFFLNKNSFGLAVVFTVSFAALIPRRALRNTARVVLGVMLLLAGSATAILAAIVVVATQTVLPSLAAERRTEARGGTTLAAVGALLGVSGALVAKNLVLAALGRDADLTGRDVIWRTSLEQAFKRPFLGHGPAGFWNWQSKGANEVQREAGWNVLTSHQSLIEMMLDYGLVGVALMVALVIGPLVQVLRRIAAGDDSPVVLVSAGLVLSLIVEGLTEPALMNPGLAVLALVSGVFQGRPLPGRSSNGGRVSAQNARTSAAEEMS